MPWWSRNVRQEAVSPEDPSIPLLGNARHVQRRLKAWGVVLVAFILGCALVPRPVPAQPVLDPASLWRTLLADASALNLPTKFLEQMPDNFVRFEFDDLRTYAAEYHPHDHRMILDRTLSFNRAGGTLRPLRRLTHKELQTLYHELFHAFMDYLSTTAPSAEDTRGVPALIAFAREQQHCRYDRVLITPILQRKSQTEERFLSDEESWEALNETWAVFIGWAIWTQLQLSQPDDQRSEGLADRAQVWVDRLRKADKEADLRGYYEPGDPQEKAIAQKRFLAPAYRISAPELKILMRDVLEIAPEVVGQSLRALDGAPKHTASILCESSGAP